MSIKNRSDPAIFCFREVQWHNTAVAELVEAVLRVGNPLGHFDRLNDRFGGEAQWYDTLVAELVEAALRVGNPLGHFDRLNDRFVCVGG